MYSTLSPESFLRGCKGRKLFLNKKRFWNPKDGKSEIPKVCSVINTALSIKPTISRPFRLPAFNDLNKNIYKKIIRYV